MWWFDNYKSDFFMVFIFVYLIGFAFNIFRVFFLFFFTFFFYQHLILFYFCMRYGCIYLLLFFILFILFLSYIILFHLMFISNLILMYLIIFFVFNLFINWFFSILSWGYSDLQEFYFVCFCVCVIWSNFGIITWITSFKN